jgi:hypothetical protein
MLFKSKTNIHVTFVNVLWAAFLILSGSLSLVKYPAYDNTKKKIQEIIITLWKYPQRYINPASIPCPFYNNNNNDDDKSVSRPFPFTLYI